MEKPGIKFIVIFNTVLCLPLAIVMSVTATLLNGEPLLTPNLFMNVLIGFITSFAINLLVPIQLISAKFAGLFKLNPESLPGALVGGLPVCLIFTVVVGLVLTFYNVVIVAHQPVPVVIFAFLGTAIPLYCVLFVASQIFTPIALKAAQAAGK